MSDMSTRLRWPARYKSLATCREHGGNFGKVSSFDRTDSRCVLPLSAL